MEHRLDSDKKDHALLILQNIDMMRQERKNCDFIIKLGNDEIPVHRNVISAGSDYFKAMLAHDNKESSSGVVEMKDVDFEMVKKCIDFIYTGEISISEDKCEKLLYVGSMLQIPTLCEKVAPFLQTHLNAKSFFNIRRIASKFNLSSLSKLCIDFALKNLDLIVKEKEFDELEKDFLTYLLVLKRSSHPSAEDSKLAMTLKWIKADIENRREHLIELMELLDLQKLSLSYGKYLATNEPICAESLQCVRMLYLAAMDKCNVTAKPTEVTFPAFSDKNAIVVFNEAARHLQAYNVRSKAWSQLHVVCEEIMNDYYTAVVVEDVLYVMLQGRKVYMTDMTDKFSRWFQMRDMLEEHGRYLRSTTYDNHIYVTGIDSIERFSIKDNVWAQVNSSGVPCDRCALVECDGYIYTIGGHFGEELELVHKFSPKLHSWSSVKSMQVARATPAAAVFNDNIYVAGGYYGSFLAVVENYEPKTDTWVILSPMNIARSNFTLTVADNKLFAVGCGSRSLSMEVYDPEKDEWDPMEMPDINIEASAVFSIKLRALSTNLPLV